MDKRVETDGFFCLNVVVKVEKDLVSDEERARWYVEELRPAKTHMR